MAVHVLEDRRFQGQGGWSISGRLRRRVKSDVITGPRNGRPRKLAPESQQRRQIRSPALARVSVLRYDAPFSSRWPRGTGKSLKMIVRGHHVPRLVGSRKDMTKFACPCVRDVS